MRLFVHRLPASAARRDLRRRPLAMSFLAPILFSLATSFSTSALAAGDNVAAPPPPMRGFGVVAKIGFHPAADDRQLDLIRRLGASVIVWTPDEWAAHERVRGTYTIRPEIQHIIARIAANNMQMVVLLFRKNQIYDNPLDPAAFARYSAWIATALKDQPVAAFQIWNEPSNFDFRAQYGGSWNGRGYAPWVENYSELTRQAAAAIRAADPHALIIANLEGPALAYALKQYPQDFRNLDGIALHPYTFRGPAESVPWGGAIVDVRDGVASADSDHSLASYLRIAAVDNPQAYLGRPLAPWVTEYGFPTCDSAQAKSMYACVTPEVQAAYHVRGLILGLSQSVKLWTVYEFADEGDNPAADGDNFGLVASAKHNFAPKPAFFALQRVATILGPDWRAIPQPPARLAIATNDAGRTIFTALDRSPASTTEGPQAFWFATPSSYVAFLWRAGPYDTDTVDSRVELPSSLALHSSNSIRVIDLVSGAILKPQVTIEQGAVRVDHLPLGSRPLALEFPINHRPSAPASAN